MKQQYCLHPVVIDANTVYPCGKCPVCRMKYRRQMALRIYMEQAIEKPSYSYFLTLTYNDENIPVVRGRHCFDQSHLTRFIDSLRHKLRREGFSLRYFGTCEYGEAGYRPHYHFVLFLYGGRKLARFEFNDSFCRPLWHYGFTYCEYSSLGSIMYCTCYALKDDSFLERDWRGFEEGRPFRLFSNRPGLGLTDRCVNWWSDYVFNDGDIRNTLRKTARYRSISSGVPVGIKRKLSDFYPDIHESLKAQNIEYFEESISGLFENAWKYGPHKVYRHGGDFDAPDETVDREMQAFRKALRTLRKQQKTTP